MSSSGQEKLNILLKWFDEHKIKWNKEALQIKESNGSFGVYAKKNVKKGKSVVKIPKECILSIKTTGIANILDEANLEGGCPLALAVLYELAQKEASPWYGYLQALPDQGEDLPIFWDEEDQALFAGTEMESAIQNDLDDLEDDYGELIEPVLEAHPYIFDRGTNLDDDPYSFDRFIKVSTLISSRAFEVDAYHENALVPFADMFNHRGVNEHVHFETEFEVCDACGAPEYCEHEYLTYLEQEEEDKGEDDEEIEAVEDENDEAVDEDEWEDEEEEEEEMSKDTELPDLDELEKAGIDFYDVEEDDDDDDIEKKDTCDMVLDRDIKKGEEVFNTYGDHPNIALLSKYGFCYDDNKNDYVSISEDSIVECCLAISAELIRQEKEIDEKEVEKLALERTRPRWEFFLQNEQILCPSEDDDEEETDDYDDYQDECCSGDDHEHGHEHGHEHEHEHDEDGGCCGDENDMAGRARPYFINHEGLFEDKVMCLLYVMFVPESTFATFVEDAKNALTYFEDLSKNKGNVPVDVKRNVYQVCLALVEYRRLEYLEDNEWKPIAKEIEERDEAAGEDLRKFYALTCRISEKKIIEKAIKYYTGLIKEYSSSKGSKSSSSKKNKKNKKIKL
ncbi:MAG: hypothetical protein EXX96DRAFT_364050 [Benjaminiella poitrasii]|nr:MAG: hypothetical protein EXX96DRAFT_364050 [Benjaminiella poitrasii]